MSQSDIAISVHGLGKQYRIARNARETHSTLAESLIARARRPFARGQTDSFWALRDVSFDIKRGDVVGVIGRNGAGKSTLLKVLSRITQPTTGEIDVWGRIGSLLEVGTGFHPELTGRENIFLNGAILGMTRGEIRRRFDEIVDFAEVEKFLDTPVKRYSSGMYVRLAFAVAAHLEPEILIVDEVLAVGDATFQKKCLGKMQDVADHGRTVIFVSHNMPMVNRLCTSCLLLRDGEVAAVGSPTEVGREYMTSGDARAACVREWPDDRMPGDEQVSLKRVRVLGPDGRPSDVMQIQHPVQIEITYVNHAAPNPAAAFHLRNEDGVLLFASADLRRPDDGRSDPPAMLGERTAVCTIPGNLLAEGHVFVLIAVCSYNPNHVHGRVPDVVQFTVVDNTNGSGARGTVTRDWPGVVRPRLSWISHAHRTPLSVETSTSYMDGCSAATALSWHEN